MRVHWLTAFIDRPASTFDAAVAFWLEVTGSTLSSWRGNSQQFATLLPTSGDAYLRIQRVLDGPGGSHLDVHVDDIGALSERAVALGATVISTLDDVIVHRSPAGFTFCAVPHHGESSLPAPATSQDGPRTLVDQLCIDVPPARFDAECSFWSALTGWELHQARFAEYHYLERPPNIAFRLLLQRLDDEPAHTDAHLDVSCSDVDAVVGLHLTRGATIVAEHEWWTTLADPSGVRYCLLRRDPATPR